MKEPINKPKLVRIKLSLTSYSIEEIKHLISVGVISPDYPKEFYNNEFWDDFEEDSAE